MLSVAHLALLVIFLGLFSSSEGVGVVPGAVPLNNITFNKIVAKFPYSLVKFDKFLAHGEKQNVFKKLAASVGGHEKLLIAEVHIAEFGEKENEDLAEKFEIKRENYPVYKLFRQKKGTDKSTDYTGNKESLDDIMRFLIKETGLTYSLPSCLEDFDNFAARIIKYEDKKNLINGAEKMVESLADDKDRARAEIYVKQFRKIAEKGETFVESEMQRLERLLPGKLSENKRAQIRERLNILTCISYQMFQQ